MSALEKTFSRAIFRAFCIALDGPRAYNNFLAPANYAARRRTLKGLVMRQFLSRWIVALAMLLGTASVSSASTIALDVTSPTQLFSVGGFNNVGWQFQVNSTITVDGLGLFDVGSNGLAESHQVGLWTNAGVLLASATVSNGSTFVTSVSTAGDWLFQNITPLALAPGTYIVGGFYATSADQVMGGVTINATPQVSFLASRASFDVGFASPGVYGLVQPGVFGPNLRFQDQAAVPEPASLLLLGSGLAVVALRLRRKGN